MVLIMFVPLSNKFFQTRTYLFFSIPFFLLIAGCGEHPQAQYVTSKVTNSLIDEARTGKFDKETNLNGVEDYLSELFGTPSEMVAWQRLPIHYGGIQGTVLEVKDGETFTVQFEETVDAFTEPQPAYWMTKSEKKGEQKGFTISNYNPVTNQITIQGELEKPPIAGTQFILNPGKQLKRGYSLYMQHCLHCHGTSGDGAGPTAKYLSPRPRDFRNGIFKFKSTKSGKKICRDDFITTIQQGIPGTYMPSFLLLEKEELQAIIEYVRWLAMRGEMERQMSLDLAGSYSKTVFANMLDGLEGDAKETKQIKMIQALQDYLKEEFPSEVNEMSLSISKKWNSVENDDSAKITPTKARPVYKQGSQEFKQSVERGRLLFRNKQKGACIDCHGPAGEGNGAMTETYQENKTVSPPQKYELPGLYDDWGNPIKPRDLTSGVYRGGRRPLDIYRRIRGGIEGTPMNAFNSQTLSEDEIWDLINYVMSLPFNKNQ